MGQEEQWGGSSFQNVEAASNQGNPPYMSHKKPRKYLKNFIIAVDKRPLYVFHSSFFCVGVLLFCPCLITEYWEWEHGVAESKRSQGSTYRSDGEGTLSPEDSELSPGISDYECDFVSLVEGLKVFSLQEDPKDGLCLTVNQAHSFPPHPGLWVRLYFPVCFAVRSGQMRAFQWNVSRSLFLARMG